MEALVRSMISRVEIWEEVSDILVLEVVEWMKEGHDGVGGGLVWKCVLVLLGWGLRVDIVALEDVYRNNRNFALIRI